MDLIINLYALPEPQQIDGVKICRVLPPDFGKVSSFIKETFPGIWDQEASYALYNRPVSCYIAVKEKSIVGFACYNATAKGYFGPTGVAEAFRRQGIGEALALHTLHGMREDGYGYAVIGWTSDVGLPLYKKIGAVEIPGSEPERTVYGRLV